MLYTKECDYCFSRIEFLKDRKGKWYPVEPDGTDHRKICIGPPKNELADKKKDKKEKLCGHGRDKRWCVACRYGK